MNYKDYEDPDEYAARKEEQAEREFDSIRQGDRECLLCGRPSYTVLNGNIYCRRCYEIHRAAK